MANRVALGALPGGGQGLRVSRPGFNVLDTGLTGQQLSFDSRWPVAARVHMEGTVNLGPAGNINTYVTVPFGVSFPAPPPCLVLSNNNNQGWAITDDNWNGSWQNTSLGVIVHCRIFADRLELWQPNIGNRSYKYIVMRPF